MTPEKEIAWNKMTGIRYTATTCIAAVSPVFKNDNMTNYPAAFALLLLSISTATLNAEERAVTTENPTTSNFTEYGKTHFSSGPGYAIFPEPHIQPGIREGFELIGSVMNIEGKSASVYSILYSVRVNGLVIGIADLHLVSNSGSEEASDTFYVSVGWHQERCHKLSSHRQLSRRRFPGEPFFHCQNL